MRGHPGRMAPDAEETDMETESRRRMRRQGRPSPWLTPGHGRWRTRWQVSWLAGHRPRSVFPGCRPRRTCAAS